MVGLMKPSKSEPMATCSCEPVISCRRSTWRAITSKDSSNVFVSRLRTPSLSWCWARISPITPPRAAMPRTAASSWL